MEDKSVKDSDCKNCDYIGSKVFILGAGFSKALNPQYPTLQELSKKVETRMKSLKSSSAFDKIEQLLAERYHSLPDNIKNNIEDILTYLMADLPWKTPQEKAVDKGLYASIALHDIAYQFENLALPQFNSKYQILGDFINKYGNTCITFNYDLLLEKLLHKENRTLHESAIKKIPEYEKYRDYYKIPLEQLSADIHSQSHKVDAPEILKLHGSINWLSQGDNINTPVYFNPSHYKDFSLKNFSPYIVPPVLDKTGFYNSLILRQIWQSAFDSINNACEIFIIGYSFPKTDVATRFLMEAATMKDFDGQCSTKRVHIVDLKKINSINQTCKKNGIELKYYNCSSCRKYENPKLKNECESCSNTPLDRFIEEIIKPHMEDENIEKLNIEPIN